MAKQTKQVAKVKKAIDTDIIVENAIKNIKEPAYFSPIIEELISQTLFTKEFICSSVVARSKGTKVANFYQMNNPNYDKNKPLTLFFDADEEVKFESGKKYNFIISEV